MLRLPRLRTAMLVLTMAVVPACSAADRGVPSPAPPSTAGMLNTAPSPTRPSPTTAGAGTASEPAFGSDRTDSLPVPEGAAPVIDGVLAPGEWESAAVFPMSDGAAISMLHSGATLYVAIAGSEVGR